MRSPQSTGCHESEGNRARLGSEEQAPRHAVVLLAVVQLVRDGDALEVGHLRDRAHGKAPVHEAVVDEHVAHAEQRDAQPRSEAQPCAAWRHAEVLTMLLAERRTIGPINMLTKMHAR